jgi:quinol monooxygenase YgiN
MKKIFSLFMATIFVTSCMQQQHPDYAKNLETAKKMFALHEVEDYDGQAALISKDIIAETSMYGSEKMGYDQFMANIKGYHMAFDNVKYTPEVWLPGCDTLGNLNGSVRTYGVWTGTQVQTKKELSLKGYWYFGFDEDGLINAQGDFFDFGGMLDAVYPKNLVIVSLKVKDGKLDNVLEILNSDGGLPTTKAYDGCLSLEMTINENTNTIWVVSNWETNDKYAAYLNWRQTEDTVIGAMVPFLDGGTDGINIIHPNTGYSAY